MRKVLLNMKEQNKYVVIKELVDRKGNKRSAAKKLSLSIRQINRLIKIYKEQGKSGFLHKNRNRQPINSLPQELTDYIVKLYRDVYQDFNFAHFRDMLEDRENIKVSYSTVYNILMRNSIVSPKIQRSTRKKIKEALKAESKETEAAGTVNNSIPVEDAHPRKERKKYAGEQIQMDASIHNWFSDYKQALHLAIDDCTGIIVGGYFQKEETLRGYYHVFKQILKDYGIPYSFLTDNRTIFNYRKDKVKKENKDVLTQFGYACRTLGASVETSSVSQVKGRIERANGTFQSRLVNELRLYGISDIDQANAYLTNVFIPDFNRRFALDLKAVESVFELSPDDEKINYTLAVLAPRKFDNGSSIRYRNNYYRAFDSDGQLRCFRPRTECLVIQAFDGQLLVSVDEQIYALEKLESHERHSAEFDYDAHKKEPKTRYIPPMSHPWKRASFIQQQQRAHSKRQFT
ncbi:MAG: ISNCY family transposase [Erysipelotrichaceae bacterium]|jgi:transposase